MKVQVTLNGKTEEKEYPTGWDQVSFNQLLELEHTEPVKALSTLWNIDENSLKRSTIFGFEKVAFTLKFLQTEIPVLPLPELIAGYAVPHDLNFNEVGRYWDIKAIFDSFIQDGILKPDMKKFPEIVAIAVMPGYLDSTKKQQDDFTNQIGEQPCAEVMAIANFYLLKLILLNQPTAASSSPTTTRRKNWKLAIKIWIKNSAITLRLWLWRKRQSLTEMKYSR